MSHPRLAFALFCLVALPAQAQAVVRGAGSTAASKLIEEWAREFRSPGAVIAYEGGGSSAGLRRLRAGEVAFAVSDVALSVPELQGSSLVQFPLALGGIVPVANAGGVELKLTGELLAQIFAGRITSWRAPEIAAQNPAVSLPDLAIRTAARRDGSGSTAVFTGYLSRASAEWKASGRAGMVVSWPTATQLVDGSDAMAAFVETTPGAIGYVDYSRVRSRKLAAVRLQNRAGAFVPPTRRAFQAAAETFPWAAAPAFSVLLIDQPGAESWPITAPVFVVTALAPRDSESLKRALAFFEWTMASGDPAADRLGFVALPASVATTVREAWARQFKGADGRPLYTMR